MVNGLVTGLLILIIIVVGVLGIFAISSEFENAYTTSDKVNTTGIYTNDTPQYEMVKNMSGNFADSAPGAILLAFLLAVILIVMAVWAILKRD